MPLLLANFIYSRDCKLNLRKNVDTTHVSRSRIAKKVSDIRFTNRISLTF